jgi:hypothetical protein
MTIGAKLQVVKIPGVEDRLSIFMNKKIFWLLFISLGLIADFALPLMWGIVATVPIVIVSWWVAYRSGWFE